MFVIKHKFVFLGISIALVVLSIVALFVFKLKIGIDFKGGALMEVAYQNDRPTPEALADAVKPLNLGEVHIQPTGDEGYLLKTRTLSEPERVSLENAVSLSGTASNEIKSFSSIGPSVGHELRTKAFIAIILVVLGIVLFIAFAFRGVSKPVSSWKYGMIAIVSLLHDVLIPIGLFTLMSHFYGAEVDTLFVVAVLTVLGLSVSDTIVVFDRIRENLKEHVGKSFAETVGLSLSQVYTRSINTSLTVILALLALLFLGPESTRYFAMIMTAGMFFGTYSSIFLASPLLVLVESWQKKRKK